MTICDVPHGQDREQQQTDRDMENQEMENETKMVAINIPITSGVSSSWTHV